MSSNKDTHVTEKQTIGDFIDSHKESAILIIGLIVLLVGVLKLGHMLLNVCNEARSTPVVRKILCFYSKTGKFQTKVRELKSLYCSPFRMYLILNVFGVDAQNYSSQLVFFRLVDSLFSH